MTLRLASWNVNGIRAVHGKDLFQPFLGEVQPDIVCLQETKAQQEQSPLTLEGYHEFWHSADKAGYSEGDEMIQQRVAGLRRRTTLFTVAAVPLPLTEAGAVTSPPLLTPVSTTISMLSLIHI